MKKITFVALLCAFALCACTKGEVDNTTTEWGYGSALPDLIVGFADDYATKTYIEQDEFLCWHEADLVTAFFGNTFNRQYKFNGQTGDRSGTLSHVPSGNLETGNDLEAIYALYPYDEDAYISEEGVISLTMPAVQQYAADSFGKGANTMIAVTESVNDTFLAFRNAGGYLQLQLYGEDITVKSIEIKGNNGEKIAGATTATMTYGGVPSVVMNDDATTSVVLDCGDGVELSSDKENPTAFWFVLPVTEFSEGITIKVTDTEDGVFEQSTSNVIPIERNLIQPMTALKVGDSSSAPAVSNNEIWYTATEKVEPFDNSLFGANYVSNEWDSATGQGVITFDGDVTEIGQGAFSGCRSLTSITIPDSVTEIGTPIFTDCESLEGFYGKYASEDNHSLIKDGVLIALAPAANITSYTIPDSVTKVGEYALYKCTSLESITIPDSVTALGNYAFTDCQSLKKVTIPSSVASIGDGAFLRCTALNEVYCNKQTPATLGASVFESNVPIYVPVTLLNIYKAADGWKEYAENIYGYFGAVAP